MKHRWPTKPLGEVVEISRERIEPTEHPDTAFNYIGLESIEAHTGNLLPYQPTPGAEIRSTKNVFHPGDILYGKLRPYLNKVHLASTEGICSTDIYVLRPRQRQLHPSFAANYLRSPSVLSVVSNAMAGANLPRIGADALLGIPIPVPPLAEQERIVKLLDEADGLRQRRAQADRRTAALLPALFHEMFGDPATNPKRWPVVPALEAFEKIGYGVGTPPPFADAGLIFLRGMNIKPSGINLDGVVYFADEHAEIMSRSKVHAGDVVIVRRGANTGDAACIPPDLDGAYVGYDLILRPKREQILGEWFVALFNSPSVTRYIRQIRERAAQQGLNAAQIGSLQIPLPPLSLQQEFAGRVGEIRALEAGQAASRRRLEALFQSLLHRAFAGEL